MERGTQVSANNWAMCPRCHAQALVRSKEFKIAAEKSYGKVSPDEYLAARERAALPLTLEESLREDYLIGIGIDGKFTVDYLGRCDPCGLEFRYSYSAMVPMIKKAGKETK